MSILQPLAAYGLSADRGFLSQHEIDEITLPPMFAGVEFDADRLSELLTTGRVRHWLQKMPTPDIDAFLKDATDQQIATAMVRYSFLAQAYVWGEPAPCPYLPANIAVPFYKLSGRMGLEPILNYAGYVLDNWYRIDKAKGITLDNIAMRQNFLGGVDENWFVLIHVAIEAVAGQALQLAVELVDASNAKDAAAVEAKLIAMNGVWDQMNGLFDRMIDHCDPYIYYNRVRPYIHGWKNNPGLPEGLIYEGIDAYGGKPYALRGQTGSQSSIVPTMDALYQVVHSNDELREFLAELHAYRPVKHRQFIEDMQAASHVRDFAVTQSQSLKDAFNACVEQVARFRTRHLEYAASYINKQQISAAGNDTDVGTGGTPFMKYLKKHRDENRAQTI